MKKGLLFSLIMYLPTHCMHKQKIAGVYNETYKPKISLRKSLEQDNVATFSKRVQNEKPNEQQVHDLVEECTKLWLKKKKDSKNHEQRLSALLLAPSCNRAYQRAPKPYE